MEKYRDMKLRKKSFVKLVRNLVFFVLLIIFTFWFIFKDQDLGLLFNTIKSVNLVYILIGTLLLFISICMESINVRSLLFNLGERKIPFLKAVKFSMIGYFFSAITPAATGGQPVEIYYMNKENISSAKATLAMLIQVCSFQITTILLSFICLLFNPSILDGELIWLYLIGVSLNAVALFFEMIAIFSKRLTKILIDIVVVIMRGLKVRNVDKKVETIYGGLDKYNESAKFILTHKGEFVKSIIRVMIQMCLFHSIAYCVYLSFGFNELNFFKVFSTQAVLYTTVSSIPLPGSIGVSESLFLEMYGKIYGSVVVSGAMLVFRLVSFYIHVIISAVVVVINALVMKNVESEADKSIDELDKTMELKIIDEEKEI